VKGQRDEVFTASKDGAATAQAMMERGWGESVQTTAQCLNCELADECRAPCPHAVDIPRYLSHIYTTYVPLIEKYRQTH